MNLLVTSDFVLKQNRTLTLPTAELEWRLEGSEGGGGGQSSEGAPQPLIWDHSTRPAAVMLCSLHPRSPMVLKPTDFQNRLRKQRASARNFPEPEVKASGGDIGNWSS